MASLKDLLGMKPKHVYLTRPSDFANFQSALEAAGNLLLPGWRYSFKVGGALHRQMQMKGPSDPILQKLQKLEALQAPTVHVHASSSFGSSHVAV